MFNIYIYIDNKFNIFFLLKKSHIKWACYYLMFKKITYGLKKKNILVILPKEFPRRLLIVITPFLFPKPTHVKATHQVKFIPSSSYLHLNSSLIFSFSSHCLCSLSSFLIFFIFFSLSKCHCIILSFNIFSATLFTYT